MSTDIKTYQEKKTNGKSDAFMYYTMGDYSNVSSIPSESKERKTQNDYLENFFRTVEDTHLSDFDYEESETSVMSLIKSSLSAITSNIKEMIESYEDELSREQIIPFMIKEIDSMWKYRNHISINIKKVLSLLEVVIKNSKYQNYSKRQLEIINEKINYLNDNINLLDDDYVREFGKQLLRAKIDIFVPLTPKNDYIIIKNGK